MKLFAFVIILLLGSFSFAQTPTKYDRIKELYDTAQPVTLAELNNVWNGRCFYGHDRDKSRYATFGIPEITDDSAGPEFQTENFRILIFDSYGTSTNRIDAIESYRNQIVIPTEAPGGVEILLDGIQYGIRKSGSYIMVFNITEDLHCYFFEVLK